MTKQICDCCKKEDRDPLRSISVGNVNREVCKECIVKIQAFIEMITREE